MPALRAMIEALVESEQVCINVSNGAHEAEAREVLHGLPMEQIPFVYSDKRTVVSRSRTDFSHTR